jgi:hypothetical protein
MSFQAVARVFTFALALSATSTASETEDCRTYPPGPQRLACASAQHPGMIAKQARCKEAGMQMGLNEAHGGGLQQYVMACMQRK